MIGLIRRVALILEVLLGAMLTALGAALKGPNVCCIKHIPSLYLPDIGARQTS